MKAVIKFQGLSKRYGDVTALDDLDLSITGPSIIGLLGKNGSGKTTLIKLLMGLHLPTTGGVSTLDIPGDRLGHKELNNIGYVPQEIRLLDWMTVGQHLEYVSTFYYRWDNERQQDLLDRLELNTGTVVGTLSQGNLQKLAIILAVCHHPKLLVLDEPVSDLDPIVRRKLLEFLLHLMAEDDATIIISSHVLRDVEKVVNWVVCLDQGKLVTDAALDDLKESYTEWLVDVGNGTLPESFSEPYILNQEMNERQARLMVRNGNSELSDFCQRYDVEVNARPLNLDELFPLLIGERLQ